MRVIDVYSVQCTQQSMNKNIQIKNEKDEMGKMKYKKREEKKNVCLLNRLTMEDIQQIFRLFGISIR